MATEQVTESSAGPRQNLLQLLEVVNTESEAIHIIGINVLGSV